MKKHAINTIVWDLDNTVCDWVSYASKTYPAMRDTLVRMTGTSRDRVTECMQAYYGRAETLESSWLVQDMERKGLLQLTEAEQQRLITSVQRSFHACRRKYLRLFEGFPEVFEQAKKNKVRNFIHTDAPARHATSRFKFLGLDQELFEGMIAMPDSLPGEVPERYRKSYDGGRNGLTFPVYLADAEKPFTTIAPILDMTHDEIAEGVAFAGDHHQKDMGMAHRHNALGFHAQWGKARNAELEIVRGFSDPRIANRNSVQTSEQEGFPTVISAGHPLDIARILGWD